MHAAGRTGIHCTSNRITSLRTTAEIRSKSLSYCVTRDSHCKELTDHVISFNSQGRADPIWIIVTSSSNTSTAELLSATYNSQPINVSPQWGTIWLLGYYSRAPQDAQPLCPSGPLITTIQPAAAPAPCPSTLVGYCHAIKLEEDRARLLALHRTWCTGKVPLWAYRILICKWKEGNLIKPKYVL